MARKNIHYLCRSCHFISISSFPPFRVIFSLTPAQTMHIPKQEACMTTSEGKRAHDNGLWGYLQFAPSNCVNVQWYGWGEIRSKSSSSVYVCEQKTIFAHSRVGAGLSSSSYKFHETCRFSNGDVSSINYIWTCVTHQQHLDTWSTSQMVFINQSNGLRVQAVYAFLAFEGW